MQIPFRLLSKRGAVRERRFLRAALPPTEQRKEKKKLKNQLTGSGQRHGADVPPESDVCRKKLGGKGRHRTRGKGRQLKIKICVKLEERHAHARKTSPLSHPVHTRKPE